ncbi:hypothetical protein T492DRAFT_1017010 [Pavlovales sp. CCMP2436]|nr:hypothetical protein T492DRAFT_1017010 [Pavlovales sp. CCMP2436]
MLPTLLLKGTQIEAQFLNVTVSYCLRPPVSLQPAVPQARKGLRTTVSFRGTSSSRVRGRTRRSAASVERVPETTRRSLPAVGRMGRRTACSTRSATSRRPTPGRQPCSRVARRWARARAIRSARALTTSGRAIASAGSDFRGCGFLTNALLVGVNSSLSNHTRTDCVRVACIL